MLVARVSRAAQSGRFLRSPWLAMSIIVLAVAAVYSNSLSGPFISDDLFAIADNATIRSLWPISKVLDPPGEGKTVQGRPVVNLSLAVNYALGGQRVVGYHLFNLAVHILAALVLFGTVRRTLLLPGRPERLAGKSTGLALAVALLWGVHPLTTNAVTYTIQRAESLMSLFYLLTVYCVIRSATGGSRGPWQTAAVLACLLGMGCKEVMVSVPLMVLLYDRVFLSRSLKECFQRRGLLYAGLAATWVLLGWLVITAGSRGGTAGFGGGVAWWEYGLTQCCAVVNYLKLCFWPHPLIFYYGDEVVADPMKVLPQATLLIALLAGALVVFRRQPWIGFLGVCFFAILAPSSSVVPVVSQTIAEQRMYLPLAIVVVLTVSIFHKGWETIWAGREQDSGRWCWLPALALIVTVTILGSLTFLRNRDYRTALEIWTDVVNKCPQKPFAYKNRGDAYQSLGQFQQALADYTQAITLRPDYVAALYNRGNTYLSLDRFQEAIADYTQAITLKPDYFPAYNNRGHTCQRLGQFPEALADFTRAIAVKPDYFEAYNNRGTTYQSLGQWDQAIKDFTHAIALKPDFSAAYYNRASSCQSLGQLRQALEDYNQAIALEPDSFQAYTNRANVYQYLGQFDQAVEDYNRAIQLKPSFALAFANRAMAFYNLRQYKQAWSDVAKARELGVTPDAQFLRMLTEASRRSGN